MANIQTIAPCLWFDGRAEEAARFYVSLFPESRVEHVLRSGLDWPGGAAGDVVTVDFTLAGRRWQALNGGPGVPFTDAVSVSVTCRDQAEIDRLWDALTADGGEPVMCGWLKDRYGLRWQIVPEAFFEMVRDDDPAKANAVMAAMMEMVKLDVAALKRAYDDAGR